MLSSFYIKLIHFIKKMPNGTIWQTRYICLPLTLIASTLAVSHSTLSIIETFFWFFLGVFIWTLLEYILHRWLLHHRAKSILGKTILARLHTHHHKDTKNQGLVCLPIFLTLPIWVNIFILFVLFGGHTHASVLVTCGIAFMMVIYDICHFSTHYMTASN